MARKTVEKEFQRILETAKPKYFMEKAKAMPEITRVKIPKISDETLSWSVHSLIRIEEITSIAAVMEINTQGI